MKFQSRWSQPGKEVPCTATVAATYLATSLLPLEIDLVRAPPSVDKGGIFFAGNNYLFSQLQSVYTRVSVKKYSI